MNVDTVRFRTNDNSEWKEHLRVFNDAKIGKQKVIVNNKIKIRLQGIDAPELHLQIDLRNYSNIPKEKRAKMWKRKFRQNWGARAVFELASFLKTKTNTDGHTIDAYAFSRVDKPNDVFDKYARFVGDIVLVKSKTNLNQWLVEKTWAFPDFYNSMSAKEISILASKGKAAKRKGSGIWKGYDDTLCLFDPEMYWKKKIKIDQMTDKGPLNIPKLFRRQVYYEEFKKAEVSDEATLKEYLAKGKDKCYVRKDYFKHGIKASKYKLADFINLNGRIKFYPGQLIFIEDSTYNLRDNNGKLIKDWNHGT
jgi:endonuclease YncB( thermonuclease family)